MTINANANLTATATAAVVLLAEHGHLEAARAASYNERMDDPFAPYAVVMTIPQAQAIAKIATKRGQGFKPYVCGSAIIMATEEDCRGSSTSYPRCYWVPVEGNWTYRSCTGHTECVVYRDGRVVGTTVTAIGRRFLESQLRAWCVGDATPTAVKTSAQGFAWAAETAKEAQRNYVFLDNLTDSEVAFAVHFGAPVRMEWAGDR